MMAALRCSSLDQGTVDVLDHAEGAGVDVGVVAERGPVHQYFPRRCPTRWLARRLRADPMTHRAALHEDHLVETIAPVWSGRQAEPAADRQLANGPLQRGGGEMMAFVGDHQPVASKELGEVLPTGKRLQARQVDQSATSSSSPAELARFHSEQGLDLAAPLIEQRRAVDQDERAVSQSGQSARRRRPSCLPQAGPPALPAHVR